VKLLSALFVATLLLSGCSSNEASGQAAGAEDQVSDGGSYADFDAVAEAEALFADLDGASGESWSLGAEDPYEGMPLLIAYPESAFDDPSQGCIVLAWDPADYDYFQRLAELEDAGERMPGEAIWMGSARGLDVEVRAFNLNTSCIEPIKQRLGWGTDLLPTFAFGTTDGGASGADSYEEVYVPSILGLQHKDVRWWLSSNGYKFSIDIKSKRIDGKLSYNPSLACMQVGEEFVFEQEPAPGSVAENSSSTRITGWVDCEIRQ
jgi:hypothetical protein